MHKFNIFSKITDPDDFWSNRIKNMPSNLKTAFFSSIMFSLLTHVVFFLNKYVQEDTIGSVQRENMHGLTSGRWFAHFINAITRPYMYSIPWIIGIFALLSLVSAIMLIVTTLEIQSKTFVVITSFLIVAFPSLAHQFGYDYESTSYTFSLLLAVSAVYFTKKYKYGFALGAISLMLALALYQSYLGFTIGLCLILVIRSILSEEININTVLITALNYMLCGILGIAAYLASARFVPSLYGTELISYKGADTMGHIPLSMLPSLISRSFLGFFQFFSGSDRFFYINDFMGFLYFLLFLLLAYYTIKAIIVTKVYTNIVKLIILLAIIVILPIGINIVDLIAPETSASNLNIHQFVLVPIYLFVLSNICVVSTPCNAKNTYVSKWAVVAVTFLIACNYLMTSGLYYFKLHIYYERTYAFYNRVLSRIEQVDGYRKAMPVAITGSLNNINQNFNKSRLQFNEIMRDPGLSGQYIGLNTGRLDQLYKPQQFISNYLGVELSFANPAQIENIRKLEEYKNMPLWPEKGSVAVVNDVVVVKLNYDPVISITQIDDKTFKFQNAIPNLPNDFTYAWYVFKDSERIDTIWYEPIPHLEYAFSEPGSYRVLMFIHNSDGEEFISPAAFSEWVSIEGI